MMMPYTVIPTALVILRKNKINDDIVMINSKDFFEKIPRAVTISDEGVQRITEIYRNCAKLLREYQILSRKKSQKMDITYVNAVCYT